MRHPGSRPVSERQAGYWIAWRLPEARDLAKVWDLDLKGHLFHPIVKARRLRTRLQISPQLRSSEVSTLGRCLGGVSDPRR